MGTTLSKPIKRLVTGTGLRGNLPGAVGRALDASEAPRSGTGIDTRLCRRAAPKTLPKPRRNRLTPQERLNRYRHILTERTFAAHTAMSGCAAFAFFAYLAGSPPVFIDGFHRSPLAYAAFFGACGLGLIAASQVNARIVRRLDPSSHPYRAISGPLVGVFSDGTPRGMAALMLAGALGMAVRNRFRARAVRDFRVR
jgi:hypothetical protein